MGLILWRSHTYTYTHSCICTHCHRSNGVVGSWQLRRRMAARRLRKWKSSISERGLRRGGRPGKSPLGGDLIWEMMYSRKLIIPLYKLCLPFPACTAISDPTNHPAFTHRTHTHSHPHTYTCLSVAVRSNHDRSPFICIFFWKGDWVWIVSFILSLQGLKLNLYSRYIDGSDLKPLFILLSISAIICLALWHHIYCEFTYAPASAYAHTCVCVWAEKINLKDPDGGQIAHSNSLQLWTPLTWKCVTHYWFHFRDFMKTYTTHHWALLWSLTVITLPQSLTVGLVLK